MKVVILKKTFKVLQGVALSATVFFASAVPVSAANLSMANTPLFLGAAVQPNVFFVSDDSGSMDWEFVTPAHWRWYNYDPDPIRSGTFSNSVPISSQNTDGTLDSAEFESTDSSGGGYGYIYSNSDNVYGNDCTSSYYASRTESCADSNNHPLDVDWRGRSAGLNKIFYNTNIEYQPWDGPCDTSGTACANASYNAVRSDPYSTQPGYSITRDLATDGDANNGPFIYEVWIDDSGYDVTGPPPLTPNMPHRGDRFNETGHASTAFTPVITSGVITSDAGNNEVDLWDSHLRFTVSNAEINVKLIEYNPVPSGGAGVQGLNETIRVDTNISNPACYDVLGTDVMVKNIRDKILIDPANAVNYIHAENSTGCKTIAEVRQNAANWYQYYRRRAFPVKNAIAEVIDAQPTFRFGMTLINRYDQVFTEVPDISLTNFTAHNTSIKQKYFAYRQASNGTPLRAALYRAGQYFEDSLTTPDAANPIVYSCQKNFTILFTDGYYSSSFSTIGNSDNDGVNYTLGDIAHHFYINDLNKNSLDDNVQVDLPLEDDLPLTSFSTKGDPRTHQHMVTFTVAFGVAGNLVDENKDGLPDFDASGNAWTPTKNGNWAPDVFSSDARKRDLARIDDLWHAAYNSAGVFASASTPSEVSEKLIKAISAIAGRVGSASAVALNSGTLNANSRLYQARFNSNGWSGDIFSVPIQDGPVDIDGIDGDDSPPQCNAYPTLGETCDMEWSGAEQLSKMPHSDRNIFTMKTDDHSIVEFKILTDLSLAQQTALKTDPDTLVVEADSRGQDRINYIRGDHSKEKDVYGGSFRTRLLIRDYKNETDLPGLKSVLGDIIHSAPAFAGAPAFAYPNNLENASYTAYKILEKARKGIVYVSSNEGMLHAFDSITGDEQFAYTPGALTSKLNLQTSPVYNTSHSYYLDGSPIIFDAYNKGSVNTGWKTMLASSAGAGTQLVFGLNVTNPESTNFAKDMAPWEFTDNAYTDADGIHGDVDLGFTLGDVSYGKMNNTDWAVIFGNGYNNTFADGNISTTGNAVIYIVDAFTGALIKKLDTKVGMAEDPTGGSRPNGISTVTPVDMDGDYKVDFLYAGDLFGNVWKVDVTNSNESSWDFAYHLAGKPKPFFIAKDNTGVEQPITSALAIKRHPLVKDQTLVLFGTGKYFEVGDSASAAAATQIQTFYGIWDNNTGIQYVKSNLLQQKIDTQVMVTGTDGEIREFRVTTSEKNSTDYAIDWSTDKGWYMDLRYGTEYGERVVTNPLIRNNRVIFVTQTPDEDPCSAGGSSWIMEINANDGNRLDVPPFDVNGDGIINDLDVVSYLSDKDTITSGVRSKSGIVAQPGILNKNQGKASEFKYFSGTKDGGIDVVVESANSEFRKRQSWRQIR